MDLCADYSCTPPTDPPTFRGECGTVGSVKLRNACAMRSDAMPMVLVAFSLPLTGALAVLPQLPTSPNDMMQRAAAAVSRATQENVKRQIVRIVVPDDERTYKVFGAVEIQGTSAPEDLDPWPGGLKQQFPIALQLARNMLKAVTGKADVSDQVLDAEDACGLILAQGATPAEDAACVLFPGTDQMSSLAKVDAMAANRLLCLLNPQFKRLEDFSLWQKGAAKANFFDRGYETTYAFEEFAVRGEDVKLCGEYGLGWRAFVVLDDTAEAVPLHEGALPERPAYTWLEATINDRHPEPRWARKMGEAEDKGLRFMRKDE